MYDLMISKLYPNISWEEFLTAIYKYEKNHGIEKNEKNASPTFITFSSLCL